MGDQEDKQWLYENGHLPITGGKVNVLNCGKIVDWFSSMLSGSCRSLSFRTACSKNMGCCVVA